MKTLKANVYGKEYTLACDEGQETHLQQLVQQINARAGRLEKAVGKLPEPLMLLYVALMVADELHDATRDNVRLKDELTKTHRLLHETPSGDDPRLAALEEEVAGSLQELAARIEGLAGKLAS